jgi:hypothetical protein
MRPRDPVGPKAGEVARGPGDDDDDVTPIGDPDDDEDWDDDDEEDDEEPLQVRDRPLDSVHVAMQHNSRNSGIINPLR